MLAPYRCEVKVIDLGSSCFISDHLSSYVQSRSYRAPEVILGLTYDQKIDIWSFGCILAELLTGSVLFQVCTPTTAYAVLIPTSTWPPRQLPTVFDLAGQQCMMVLTWLVDDAFWCPQANAIIVSVVFQLSMLITGRQAHCKQ